MTIYQEEMQRKAQRYGCITDYDEADQLLLISHKGVHLTAVNPEGFMFYNSKIGQEYLLNRDGAIPANDDANPKYAEIGRRLMQSGTGIVTEHGILFVDEDIPFQELYDGQVFPPYLYDASILCTAKAEYQGKVEYLYLPCERAAIDKSIGRLGAPDADSVSIILDDFMVDNPEWMRRLREMTSSESIYDINDLVGAISNADMQLDKLTAVAEYAGVEDISSMKRPRPKASSRMTATTISRSETTAKPSSWRTRQALAL